MRIMTISNAAWDDCNSVGNTQSNWFSNWPNSKILSLYTREAIPNNTCCDEYYCVTIKDIAKHIFNWKKIGRYFGRQDIFKEKSIVKEKKYSAMRRWKKRLLEILVEIIYSSKIWFNKKLKNYIEGFHPDVVFCFAIAEPFRYNVVKYIKNNTHSKVVIWVADDVCGQIKRRNPISRGIYMNRYHRMFAMADRVYGVSEMLCKEYSQLFDVSIDVLYKGCDFMPVKKLVNKPIQIVYAGNLLYGRDQTLSVLAKQIDDINKDDIKIQLSIYSATHVSDAIYHQLNLENSSKMCGARPYEEIKIIMSEADVVLHVESFRADEISKVRLSFSTKIIDCLQSGSVLLVVGPQEIASVEYVRSIDGVIVVDNLASIKDVLWEIVNNPDQLIERAQHINNYAIAKHDIKTVRAKLEEDFYSIIAS